MSCLHTTKHHMAAFTANYASIHPYSNSIDIHDPCVHMPLCHGCEAVGIPAGAFLTRANGGAWDGGWEGAKEPYPGLSLEGER